MIVLEVLAALVWVFAVVEFGIIVIYNILGEVESDNLKAIIRYGLLHMFISFIVSFVRGMEKDNGLKARSEVTEIHPILEIIVFVLLILGGLGLAFFLSYSIIDEIKIKTIKNLSGVIPE